MHLPSKLSQDISQSVAKSRLNIKLLKIYDDGSRNVLISAEQTKGVLFGDLNFQCCLIHYSIGITDISLF